MRAQARTGCMTVTAPRIDPAMNKTWVTAFQPLDTSVARVARALSDRINTYVWVLRRGHAGNHAATHQLQPRVCAHTGSQTRATSTGGLHDAAALCALVLVIEQATQYRTARRAYIVAFSAQGVLFVGKGSEEGFHRSRYLSHTWMRALRTSTSGPASSTLQENVIDISMHQI